MVNKKKQRMGSENGRWKGGKSSDYRRRITKAKPGEIVHHKDKTKTNNTKSNFEKVKGLGEHNKKHPEKALKGGIARGKQLKK